MQAASAAAPHDAFRLLSELAAAHTAHPGACSCSSSLVWTPARLTALLNDGSSSCSSSSTLTPRQPPHHVPRDTPGNRSIPPGQQAGRQLVPLLPLVSSVAASQQQAAGASCSRRAGGSSPHDTCRGRGVPPQVAAADQQHAVQLKAEPGVAGQTDTQQQQQQQHQQHQQQQRKPQRRQQQRVALPPKGCSPDQCAATADNAAWDPARLQAAAAAAAAALGVPSGVQAASAPDAAASAQFGVLVLAHERGVPAAQAWAAWADAHAGRVAVGVHLKAGVACAGLPGASWLAARQLRTRVDSRWGCVSLTAAVLAGAADMLAQHPGLAHLAVVSGQDVPVALLPRELPPGLSMVGCFQFGAAFDAAAGAAAAQLLRQALGMAAAEARAWAESLTFHHTWMVLDRQLLLALLSKREDILRVGAVLNQRFMQPDAAVAADEFMLVTAALRYGFVQRIVRRRLPQHLSALHRQQQQQQQRQQQGAGLSPTPPHESGSSNGGRQSRAAKRARAAGGPTQQQAAPKQQRASRSSGRASTPAAASAAAGGTASATAASEVHGTPGSTGSSSKTELGAASSSSCSPMGGSRRRSARVAGAADPATGAVSDRDSSCCQGALTAAAPPAAAAVLLDCCPTLALFHPDADATRHPHEWVSFSQMCEVDVRSSRLGSHKLTLLQALGLSQPNGSLFFRKLGQLSGGRAAEAQLMACLRLLWRGKRLPPCVEELGDGST